MCTIELLYISHTIYSIFKHQINQFLVRPILIVSGSLADQLFLNLLAFITYLKKKNKT